VYIFHQFVSNYGQNIDGKYSYAHNSVFTSVIYKEIDSFLSTPYLSIVIAMFFFSRL